MMSVPEEWAWLEEMPEGWPTPAEITGPTAVPATNLVLLMLSSEMLGNDLVELVGEFIAEDARFNSWIGAEGKHELSMRQVAECSALLRECTKSIYEAWHDFSLVYERAQRAAGSSLPERRALFVNLKSASEKLRNARMK
ncbi:hypothetical protein LXH13_00540 [Streptomyces spinosirectus]|jgi:hypothetical protein|uniref:hypothetical protein n=2 Tax=Streptomyces TaxID=1883 RepID=UPI000FFE75EB|nr:MULTISPECIES: hypothetical protein [Streptomyces]MBY8343996.1 hypothetical protein [Streptomyces plumbidurans]UIR15603.1 hypothetical protein LXH13_00540 [Streptomyces spinosirectus]